MKKENKKNSIKYWDKHAELWLERVYDKNKKFLNFPTSQERQDITIQYIEKMAKNKKVSIIDFGCADGELVRTLLKKGFINIKGVDNSKKMIETAKKILKKEIPGINPDKVFFVDDADNFDETEKFDFVIAMGLIEYLLDIDTFFKKLNHILKSGGCAFIESRNKLFNLFSANKYTYQSPIKKLIEELEDIKRFSPVNKKRQVEEIISKVFISIGKNLKEIRTKTKGQKIKKIDKFPFQLPQFTPKEIESFSKKNGLKLEYVVYYHFHHFLPKFENDFPVIFNRIALQTQPLGYTPLGATTCSAFIALIKK